MPEITWRCQAFPQLSTLELYKLLQLRAQVFILEQDCVYQDIDDFDQPAFHLQAIIDGEIRSYARLIPPGLKYAETTISRVISSPAARNSGYGKLLMKNALHYCQEYWPDQGVRISAQHRLQGFYQQFGFITVSKTAYLEDNIPHVEMLIAASSKTESS